MASFLAAFFGQVVGGIVHPTGNIGAAIEGFLAENESEFTLDEIEIVTEWKPKPRLPVEHHDADPVAATEYKHGLVRRLRQPFYVRLHASTYIEEQQHIDGHVLAFKMTDLLLLTIFGENEVFGLQTGDRSIVPIDNLCIDANQRHVTTKRNVFFGRCEGNT